MFVRYFWHEKCTFLTASRLTSTTEPAKKTAPVTRRTSRNRKSRMAPATPSRKNVAARTTPTSS
jgi:hypothetical protein